VSKVSLEEHRNLNTNLALPFYLFSVPDETKKSRIGDVSFSKWDSWSVKSIGLDGTVADLIEHFKMEYGLQVQSICHRASIWYHEDFADDTSETFRDLLGAEKVSFVPLNIMYKHGDHVAAGPVVKFFCKKVAKRSKKSK